MKERHRRLVGLLALVALSAAGGGCTHRVAVEPIRIEPIYITLDVNLKVDRELDRFFDFQDETSAPAEDVETPDPKETS